jgi:polyhydroxyalkanoate synthesis regulator phasin
MAAWNWIDDKSADRCIQPPPAEISQTPTSHKEARMVEFLKKAAFASVGMAVMTKEKVEEMAKKLVEESNMSEQEGRKFIDEIAKKSQDTRTAIEKMVQDGVTKAMTKLSLATKDDVKSLEKRVKELEDNH